MNTNAYYEIGSSHRVCEDYALTGQYEDMAYAIVSDGCSSSNDSDVGARLLSHIAKGALIYLKGRNIIGTDTFPDIFRELVLRKCLEVKSTLGLPSNVFDATLLISTVLGDKITCLGWGDGYIILVTKTNDIIAYETKYSSGAPYYISYEMNQGNKEAYRKEYGNDKIDINHSIIGEDGTLRNSSTSTFQPNFSHTILKEAHASAFKHVVLASDGLDTYQDDPKFDHPDGSDKKNYKAIEIIPAIVAYKNTAGEFAVRRMQRIKSDLEKTHVIHFDDISCASIALD